MERVNRVNTIVKKEVKSFYKKSLVETWTIV